MNGSTPTWDEAQGLLLVRMIEVLDLRQQDVPDDERACLIDALNEIRQARNALVHLDCDQIDMSRLSMAASQVLQYVLLLEDSSLGTPLAQQVRRSASARHIANVLSGSRIASPPVEHDGVSSTELERSPEPSAAEAAGGRFLTVAEAATVMRVSKMAVYRLVHSGELPAIRVGRSFRIEQQAVNDHINATTVPVDEAPASAQSADQTSTAPDEQGPDQITQGRKVSDHRELTAGSRGGEQRLSEIRFLTVAEVATALRVSKMTVYRLVRSGELPAIRVGRSFRVAKQAVDDYLAETECGSA